MSADLPDSRQSGQLCGDVHICGACKLQFSDVEPFLLHKQQGCIPADHTVILTTGIDVEPDHMEMKQEGEEDEDECQDVVDDDEEENEEATAAANMLQLQQQQQQECEANHLQGVTPGNLAQAPPDRLQPLTLIQGADGELYLQQPAQQQFSPQQTILHIQNSDGTRTQVNATALYSLQQQLLQQQQQSVEEHAVPETPSLQSSPVASGYQVAPPADGGGGSGVPSVVDLSSFLASVEGNTNTINLQHILQSSQNATSIQGQMQGQGQSDALTQCPTITIPAGLEAQLFGASAAGSSPGLGDAAGMLMSSAGAGNTYQIAVPPGTNVAQVVEALQHTFQRAALPDGTTKITVAKPQETTAPGTSKSYGTSPSKLRCSAVKATPPLKKHRCSRCSYSTAYQKDLDRHMRKHTGVKPYVCTECNKAFNRSDKLKIHTRSHTGFKPYKCKQCSYATGDSSSLKKHQRIHTDERPFKCQICPYASRNSSQLTVHLRTHTGDTPFSCKVCEAKFKIKSDLKRHMRIHTGEKPFLCEQCNYRCSIKGNLRSHMRINHSAENVMTCAVCSFNTSSEKVYKEHIKAHDRNLISLECPQCSYRCMSKGVLKVHMLTHSDEKPHKCDFCYYSARQRGNVKNHMKRKHPVKYQGLYNRSKKPHPQRGAGTWRGPDAAAEGSERGRSATVRPVCKKPFTCTLCDAAFVREDSLRSHVRYHREDDGYHRPPQDEMLLAQTLQEDSPALDLLQLRNPVSYAANVAPSETLAADPSSHEVNDDVATATAQKEGSEILHSALVQSDITADVDEAHQGDAGDRQEAEAATLESNTQMHQGQGILPVDAASENQGQDQDHQYQHQHQHRPHHHGNNPQQAIPSSLSQAAQIANLMAYMENNQNMAMEDNIHNQAISRQTAMATTSQGSSSSSSSSSTASHDVAGAAVIQNAASVAIETMPIQPLVQEGGGELQSLQAGYCLPQQRVDQAETHGSTEVQSAELRSHYQHHGGRYQYYEPQQQQQQQQQEQQQQQQQQAHQWQIVPQQQQQQQQHQQQQHQQQQQVPEDGGVSIMKPLYVTSYGLVSASAAQFQQKPDDPMDKAIPLSTTGSVAVSSLSMATGSVASTAGNGGTQSHSIPVGLVPQCTLAATQGEHVAMGMHVMPVAMETQQVQVPTSAAKQAHETALNGRQATSRAGKKSGPRVPAPNGARDPVTVESGSLGADHTMAAMTDGRVTMHYQPIAGAICQGR